MDHRPNIIFIITDQQRFDTIAALGHDHMDTPHMDRLVKEGVSFENCFITAASCAPARASLLPDITRTPREFIRMRIPGKGPGSKNLQSRDTAV